jgi:hypothetical protein
MDAKTLHSLTTKVPTISRRVDLNSLNTIKGAHLRARFAILCVFPLVYAFDQNGGLFTLGFGRGTTMERQFKMRPDYATGRVFAAERLELPTFKHF